MSWISSLLGSKPALNNEPSVVRRVTDFVGYLFGSTAIPGPKNAEEALALSAVYACVRVLSDDIGKLPVRLMRRETIDGIKTISVAEDHPLHRLLAVRPNSWQTSTEFVRSMVTMAALGKGALAILAKVGNEVREILPVPSGAWTQEVLSDTTTQYRVQYHNGTQAIFRQDQVLFIRGAVSIDGYSGVSVVDVAQNAMKIINGLEKQQLNFSANSGRPSGILSLEEELSPEQKAALKHTWDAAYGSSGRGGIAVLEYSTKFTPMSMSFTESQFLENRDFQIREVARFFRIDPSYLFVAGTKTYASAEATRREHYTNALMPWVVAFEQAMNRSLLNDDPEYFFDFDERDMLRGNNIEQAQYLTQLLGAGGAPAIISVNEARRELGLHELKGDRFEVPAAGGYAAPEAAPTNDNQTQND